MNKGWLLLLGWFWAASVGALTLQPYPHADSVLTDNVTTDDYRLPLGAIKKSDSLWRTEREVRLTGTLARKTWELPDGHSEAEAFAHYRQQLRALDARELFYCDGRRCGPSNAWANNFFQVKQLYGMDQTQQLGVYEVTADETVVFVTLYTVRRGNKRVYLHRDVFTAEGTEPGSIAASAESVRNHLRGEGWLTLYGLVLEGDQLVVENGEHLDALVRALQSDITLRVYLVGHDYRAAPLAESMAASERWAETVAAQLRAAGINERRFTVAGVGPLAPVRGERAFRVTVVAQ